MHIPVPVLKHPLFDTSVASLDIPQHLRVCYSSPIDWVWAHIRRQVTENISVGVYWVICVQGQNYLGVCVRVKCSQVKKKFCPRIFTRAMHGACLYMQIVHFGVLGWILVRLNIPTLYAGFIWPSCCNLLVFQRLKTQKFPWWDGWSVKPTMLSSPIVLVEESGSTSMVQIVD